MGFVFWTLNMFDSPLCCRGGTTATPWHHCGGGRREWFTCALLYFCRPLERTFARRKLQMWQNTPVRCIHVTRGWTFDVLWNERGIRSMENLLVP